MSISLQKGQRVDLTKGNTGLTNLLVGLGWDPVQSSGKKGLLGSLFGGGGSPQVDCDASVLMLDEKDKLQSRDRIIYFGNLKSQDGSVIHTGDNLTGEGDGDDEQIRVDLTKIPASVQKLVFVVNIYDAQKRNQHFGMIQNAFIRIVNEKSKQQMIKYDLSEDYSGKTALLAGEIYRSGSEWKFAATGDATTDNSLGEVVKRYQ